MFTYINLESVSGPQLISCKKNKKQFLNNER